MINSDRKHLLLIGDDLSMYVKRVFYDDHGYTKEMNSPNCEDIRQVINKLDGCTTTQITFYDETNDNHLCVGGGNNGICNVYISKDDGFIIKTLINPNHDTNVYRLVVGGQWGDFEGNICVPIKIAKKAIIYYCKTGKECIGFIWE